MPKVEVVPVVEREKEPWEELQRQDLYRPKKAIEEEPIVEVERVREPWEEL